MNYFNLNLDSGDAEIKVQKLHGNALADRNKALQQYQVLANTILGCEAFEPVRLAPAIRRLLSERAADMTKVRVVPPRGGTWEGRTGDESPADPEELRAAVTLEFKWLAPDGRKIRVGLDARISEVRILDACLPDQLSPILDQVCEWAGQPRHRPDPAQAERRRRPTVARGQGRPVGSIASHSQRVEGRRRFGGVSRRSQNRQSRY